MGIEAVAFLRREGTVDSEAVTLAGSEVRNVAMPDAFVDFQEFQPGLLIIGVEEAELDARGVFREQGEIDALAIPRRAQGIGFSRPKRTRHGTSF
jgi:hypothetical protein